MCSNYTKYYKNFILCGDVEYHCLLCDEIFDEPANVDKHVLWEKHRKNTKAQTCLPHFKNEGIYKVSVYYYCQFCNHVSYNMVSIKGHTKTQEHVSNKTTPPATKLVNIAINDEDDIIIDNLKIERDFWAGIFDERCLLCNINVSDIARHITSQDHVVREFQTETKHEGEDRCYRKVNETTYQCFYCMRPFSSDDYEKHWKYHKLDINGNFEEPIRIHSYEEFTKIGTLEYDINKLAGINDDFYNVDIKNKEIKCKQCMLVVKPTKNDLRNHKLITHKNYSGVSNIIDKITEEIDKRYFFVTRHINAGKTRHELALFSKDNHIKLNAGARRGYCLLCDRFLPPQISIFKEHVEGAVHNGHLELKGLVKPKKHKKASVTIESFLRYIVSMEYVTEFDAVSVNNSFCVNRQSFLLMKRIKHGRHLRITKCLACEETFKWWEEKKHCETELHRSYVMGAKVLLANYSLIREIKPKLYHCGMCNITLPFWEPLDKHIKDRCHRIKVTNADFLCSVLKYKEAHGAMPETRKIESSNISNVLYTNILKVLFESRLGNLRIYSMDLNKLQKPKDQVIEA